MAFSIARTRKEKSYKDDIRVRDERIAELTKDIRKTTPLGAID